MALKLNGYIDLRKYNLETQEPTESALYFTYNYDGVDTNGANMEIILQATESANFTVDWGDGRIDTLQGNNLINVTTQSLFPATQSYGVTMSGDLQEITYFDLYDNDNNLTGDVTGWGYKMPKCTYIRIGQTALSGSCSSFENMELTFINVTNTNIGGDIKSWATGKITGSLLTLYCYNSELSGSVSAFASCSELSFLSCQSSDLGGDIVDISSKTNTEYISLGGTNVYGDIGSFSGYTNCTDILMSSLPNITGSVDPLASLSGSLTRLNLGQTGIGGDLGQLSSLTKLTYLSVSDCINLSSSIAPLKALSGSLLSFYGQGCTNLHGDISGYGELEKIRSLYLYRTSVSGDVAPIASASTLINCYLYETSCSGVIDHWGSELNMTSIAHYKTDISGSVTNFGTWTNPSLIYMYETSCSGDIGSWETASWTSTSQVGFSNTEVSGNVALLGNISTNWYTITMGNTNVGWLTQTPWSGQIPGDLSFSDCSWSFNEVDDCLISLADGPVTDAQINIAGNNEARTAVSDTAYDILTGSNDQVIVNE